VDNASFAFTAVALSGKWAQLSDLELKSELVYGELPVASITAANTTIPARIPDSRISADSG
jgi:hypothetical protein